MNEQTQDDILLYVADELAGEARERIERLLAADGEARAVAERLRADLALLAPLGCGEPVDAALRDRVLAAASRSRRLRPWRWAALAASAAAAAVLAVVLATGRPGPMTPKAGEPAVGQAALPQTLMVLAGIEQLSDDLEAFEDFESDLAEAEAGDLDQELEDIDETLDGLAAEVHQFVVQ